MRITLNNLLGKALITVMAATLVTGCGFQLRGLVEVAPLLSTLKVSTPDNFSQFSRKLVRSLESNNINISDQAPYTLKVLKHERDRKVASFAGNAQAAEYRVRLSSQYQLENRNGLVIIGPFKANSERVFLHEPNNAAASASEERLITEELDKDIIRQIQQRLAALSNADIENAEAEAEAKKLAEEQKKQPS
ncbi:LPS-assembly lipoprotein LptE [Spartinivicinus ruber]|uniref:LPS-assembly lipoprotein LptE n=1 Tax=Spartinivicinus ruber TaxID=2683272 RepID=UPI0013D62B39|nr:LPS assembly lipoprotein LptE [Spartinivicinus ruber]